MIDPGNLGQGYRRLPDSVDSAKFTDDYGLRKHWVVKLEFTKEKKDETSSNKHNHVPEDETAIGTGFFLNLSGSSHDIILTAGHNLIQNDGKRTRKLRAHITAPATQSKDGVTNLTQEIDPSAIYICPEFEAKPVSENKINDWGMILLPQPKIHSPGFGFGFNLRLAFQKFGKLKTYEARDKVIDSYHEPEMRISSFRFQDNPGSPHERSGKLVVEGEERLRGDQLEYRIDTEEGMSGSPVWMPNRGGECVVAIHNYGKRSGRGRGSRGTRINERVIRQNLDWTGAGITSRALKVHHPKAPASGVYLQFHADDPEAWISIGPGASLTKFDVLLAYAPPTSSRLAPLYAMCLKSPPSAGAGANTSQWVIWNRRAETAELSAELSDGGLIDIRNKPTDKGFKIVFSRNKTREEMAKKGNGLKTVLEELRVDVEMISEDDVRRGEAEMQDFMVFDRYVKLATSKYNKFVLE